MKGNDTFLGLIGWLVGWASKTASALSIYPRALEEVAQNLTVPYATFSIQPEKENGLDAFHSFIYPHRT